MLSNAAFCGTPYRYFLRHLVTNLVWLKWQFSCLGLLCMSIFIPVFAAYDDKYIDVTTVKVLNLIWMVPAIWVLIHERDNERCKMMHTCDERNRLTWRKKLRLNSERIVFLVVHYKHTSSVCCCSLQPQIIGYGTKHACTMLGGCCVDTLTG